MESEEIKKYQRLLTKYFRKNNLKKIRFNPRIVEITETQVKFGMQKHIGIFVIDKELMELLND